MSISNKVSDHWNNILTKTIVENHSFYGIADIDKIPNTPGIYAWFLLADKTNFNEYYKVFKQKKVEINIKGNLKEKYSGEVRNTYYDDDFKDSTIDFDLCNISSLAFGPPLYIGISKDLRVRLKQHSEELQKIFYKKIILPPPVTLGKTDFDTIVESAHFAERIGYTLKSFPTIKLNSLLIKTVELPLGYPWTKLQRVEKYLNRTFIPIYGKK